MHELEEKDLQYVVQKENYATCENIYQNNSCFSLQNGIILNELENSNGNSFSKESYHDKLNEAFVDSNLQDGSIFNRLKRKLSSIKLNLGSNRNLIVEDCDNRESNYFIKFIRY